MNTVVEQPVEEDDDDDEIITRKQNIIHPFRIFTALQVYKSSGETGRGRVTCIPNPNIERALESAFYRAFQYLVPTNKRCLIAVDVSATMALPVLGMRQVCLSLINGFESSFKSFHTLPWSQMCIFLICPAIHIIFQGRDT